MTIQETSLKAYYELENLGQRQMQVYNTLKQLKEANNNMIAKFLKIPINQITPRCKELRDRKLVGVSKVDICPITKRMSIFWKIVK